MNLIKINFRLLFFICSLSLWNNGNAQKIELPSQITVGKLDNGLTYYIVPKGERGKVCVSMVAKIGSLVEKPEQHGYAHILEHMMFNGTKNYPGNTCEDVMQKMGMRQAREYQGTTGNMNTVYQLYIPENNLDYLNRCLLLFKDWMFNLDMDADVLENEKKIILEEVNKGSGMSAMPIMNGTPMEGHDVVGSRDAILSSSVEGLYDFYKKHYIPTHLAVVVTGSMDKAKTINLIEGIFNDVSPQQSNAHLYPELYHETIIDRDYKLKDNEGVALKLVSKRPSFRVDNQESLKQQLTNTLFGNIMSSRLSKSSDILAVRSQVSIVNSVLGNQMTYVDLLGAKTVSYEQLLDEFCRIMAQVLQDGFSQEEIQYESHQLLQRYAKKQNDEAIDFGSVLNHFLTEKAIMNGKTYYESAKQLIPTISSADLVLIARNFINDHKTILFDESLLAVDEVFTDEYILAKIEGISKQKMTSYYYKKPEEMVVEEKEPFEIGFIKPAKIKRKVQLADDLSLLEFKNGAKVVLDNSARDLNEIKIVADDGLNVIREGDRFKFQAVLRSLDRAYGKYSESEVYSKERNWEIFRDLKVHNYGFEYKIRSKSDDFNELLKVFYLSVAQGKQPDIKAFQKSIKRIDKSQANKPKDLYNEFVVKVNQAYLSKSIDTLCDETELDRFSSYASQLKRNFSSSIIYIGGELPDNIEELVSTYIGSIEPASFKSEKKLVDINMLPSGVIEKDFEWKRQVSIVDYLFPLNLEKELTLKDEIILQSIAEFGIWKMFEIVRGKYGLIYTTNSTIHTQKKPMDFCSVSVRYMIDAVNIPKSKRIVEDEVLKPFSHGEITDDEFVRLKAMLNSLYILSFYDKNQLNDSWLNLNVKYGRVISPQELSELIDSISKEDIQKMMRLVFNTNEYYLLIRKPE